MAVCAIEYDGKVLEAFFLVYGFKLIKHIAGKQAGAHYKEGAVGIFLDNLRIGNNIHRRAVDEYVAVFAAQFVYKIAKALFVQQLGGVGRDGTHGEHVQPVVTRVGCYCVIYVVDALAQVVAYTCFG